ncbi:MAG: hypothetical protein ACLRPV_14320 [Lacrimispora saccharolytica]
MSRKSTVAGIAMILMVLATIPLLGSDNVPFLKWWIMILIIGIGFLPGNGISVRGLYGSGMAVLQGFRGCGERICRVCPDRM